MGASIATLRLPTRHWYHHTIIHVPSEAPITIMLITNAMIPPVINQVEEHKLIAIQVGYLEIGPQWRQLRDFPQLLWHRWPISLPPLCVVALHEWSLHGTVAALASVSAASFAFAMLNKAPNFFHQISLYTTMLFRNLTNLSGKMEVLQLGL